MIQDDFLLEIQNCPVCDSQRRKILFKDLIHTCHVLNKSGIDKNNEEVLSSVYRCSDCGHKYLSHVIKEELIMRYYGIVGSEYYDSVKEDSTDREPEETRKFAQLIKKECQDFSSVLEIGSGMGHLLSELKRIGFTCTGIEPSNFVSNLSREKFGLDIVTGLLDYETFPDKKFDIIILRDVIEHIYKVNPLFDLIEHYLSPGGKIIVLTGDSNSQYAKMCGRKWLYFFSWEHISFFNKASIGTLFTRHNLSLSYFKKRRHSGTFLGNCKIFVLTLRSMLANKLGFRRHKFFYMTFDHFIAIGCKIKV